MVLRQIFDTHSGEDLDRLVDLLARSSQERRQRLIRAVWLYLINKGNVSKARVEESMDRLPEADFVPHRTPRQEYLEEGEAIGLEKGETLGLEKGQRKLDLAQIDTIQGMLDNGLSWELIERITHTGEQSYQALKSKYKN